jgi:solute carrier family 25 oxoglutarate transporter 11
LENAQNKNIAAGVDKNAITLGAKMLMGLTSGGIGSFVGTPSELALVRMSSDSKQPLKERRNYKSVGDCVSRIASEEGVPALWTGARVTVLRAMVLSACAMGMTSDIKQRLIKSSVFGENTATVFHGLPVMFCSILVSSFFANSFANPLDVIKSRMQNQKASPKDGSLKYKSSVDCFLQLVKDEGFLKLWAGFTPAFLKLAPYTIISLTLAEKITMLVTGKGAL